MRKLLVFLLVFALFVGCADKTDTPESMEKTAQKSESSSREASAVKQPEAPDENEAEPDQPGELEELLPKHEVIEFDAGGEVIEIREKLFVAQTNDIYLNAEDYLGKIIKYEGIYKEYYEELTGQTYRYVIRYGPGCCGTDGDVGFEVVWEADPPKENDWVEVSGILEEYGADGWKFLRLRLITVTILKTRGAEVVVQ